MLAQAPAVGAGVKLPRWTEAARNGITPTIPPIFTPADLAWQPATPQYWQESESGGAWAAGTPGYWAIRLYGVPPENIPYYGSDPNQLYQLGGIEGAPPQSFFFGIKAGPDQGYVYRYEFDPTHGIYVPVGATGLIGGRGGLFDTNAFNRSGNKMLAIMVIAYISGAYFAYAAPVAEAASASAEAAAAADAAAGLVPAYGTSAAYDAAIAAGAGASESAAAADLAAGLLPEYGSPAAYNAALQAGASVPLAEGAATASAWDALYSKAKDAAGKLIVQQVARQVMPGKTPAAGARVAGDYRMRDGTLAHVNPDGSISFIGPDGTQVVGAGGQVTRELVPGVPNVALALGAALAVLSFLVLR